MKKRIVCLWVLFISICFVSCGKEKTSEEKVPVTKTATTEKATATVQVTTEKEEEKIKIAIDPGHQKKQMSAQEPIGPGAGETKPMVSSGTSGTVTGKPEYLVNLEVSLKLKKVLIARGYDVYMIRESNDVSLSNKQRSQLANKSGARAFIRIHCNSDEDSSVNGALTMCPTISNPYCSDIADSSQLLSEKVLKAMCARTGAKQRTIIETDQMTGINWSTIPVTIVEMGFMSNPQEDQKLSNESYQSRIAEGIADGIDTYMK